MGDSGDHDWICECKEGAVTTAAAPVTTTTAAKTTAAWACPAIDGVTACSEDTVETDGSCRYYLPSQTIRGTSTIGVTCGQWCSHKGLGCTGMYDDTGNSCTHKNANEGCDFEGDSGDHDWICECKEGAVTTAGTTA